MSAETAGRAVGRGAHRPAPACTAVEPGATSVPSDDDMASARVASVAAKVTDAADMARASRSIAAPSASTEDAIEPAAASNAAAGAVGAAPACKENAGAARGADPLKLDAASSASVILLRISPDMALPFPYSCYKCYPYRR